MEPKDCYWNTFRNRNYSNYAPNRILKNTINVTLAVPECGNGSLEQIIIDICKEIDLKMRV